MSSGKNLQEMEVGTKQVRDAVNSKAVAGMSMQSSDNVTPGQTGSYEDLGGPTPENYRPDDDSAKLNTPGKTLKQVRDVVNKGAKPAMAAPAMKRHLTQLQTAKILNPATAGTSARYLFPGHRIKIRRRTGSLEVKCTLRDRKLSSAEALP